MKTKGSTLPAHDSDTRDPLAYGDDSVAAASFDRRSFGREQRDVRRGMIAAGLVTTIAFAAARWLPVSVTDLPISDRLAYALRCDLLVVVWLLAAVARVASARFASPEDLAGAGSTTPTPPIRQARAVLQNTLEQTVLSLPVHLALATLLPILWLGLIPMLVLLFGIGRAAFWHGYAYGAARRAFGFGLTFYPTVAAYVLSVGLIVQLVVR